MTCAKCHQKEYKLWLGSHHDQAMKIASPQTVLGNFNNQTFTKDGITSKFYRKKKAYYIQAQDNDGKIKNYKVLYTFGFYPLQQYLLKYNNGKLQAYTIAWDARTKEQGGQKWYDLYPNEKIPANDPLHWTTQNFNWNYMCAECHSTNLKKNYDPKKKSYHTTWTQINVACQACHGPGAEHVQWAKDLQSNTANLNDKNKGLAFKLKEPTPAIWNIDPITKQPKRSTKIKSNVQVQTCAKCHSRRTPITQKYTHGKPLLDTHLLENLRENLYHPDGQIQDEVYVYGSFIQSKMYHNNVRCSDCHDVHSTKIKFQGAALCTQCHTQQTYDTPKHHKHKPFGKGASCVDCHMPQKTYMIIDPRRDHSIRIPRPDLSIQDNTPNACINCHTDKTKRWAADAFKKWYPKIKPKQHPYAHAFNLARQNKPQALPLLQKVLANKNIPNIARASTLNYLAQYPSPQATQAIVQGLKDTSPLVRLASVQNIQNLNPQQKFAVAKHLLSDPIKAVRLYAASALASTPKKLLTPKIAQKLKVAIDEYLQMQQTNIDTPFAHVNLGIHYTALAQFQTAIKAYQQAIALDPLQIRAYINLADIYRQQKNETRTQQTLKTAIKQMPKNPLIYQTLAFSYIRTKQTDKALTLLKKSAQLAPKQPRFAYVYSIALDNTGNTPLAINQLIHSHTKNTDDPDTLRLLIQYLLKTRQYPQALQYAKILKRITPQDQNLLNLIRQLQQ